MASIAEIRSQFPQYADVSDAQLADAIHSKFYADMPKAEFDAKVLETKQANLEAGRHESLLNPKANERSIPAVLGQSLIKTGANLGDVILGLPENYKRIGQYISGKVQGQDVEAPRGATPVTNFLLKHDVLKPENEPNTPILKTADFAIQAGTPGMLFGKAKNIPELVKLGAEQYGQGLIGGAATEFGKASGFTNPLAEQLIAGASMAVPGSIYAMRNTPATVVNQAMRNMTPEQLSAAQTLVDRSYKLGSPITGAEAIAQVMGTSKLPSIQRYVENQPRGESASIMGDFMANRPEANRQMVGNALNEISPTQTTSATPNRLQSAAAKLLRGAESNLTSNVNPYFIEAGKNAVAKTEIEGMLQNPKIAEAVDYVRSTPKYGVKNEPQNSLKTLIAAKQYLDDEFAMQSSALTGAQKNAGRVTWSANRQLDDFLNHVSPEYAKGSQIYENAQNRQFNQLRGGQVGAISETTGLPENVMSQQSRILTPEAPKATTPTDIKRTVDLLRRKDPTVVADWTRQNLQGIFDETTQTMQGKQNQFGGAKFASKITGNEGQRANLQALVESSAGKPAWTGFNNMLEVLDAQGQRMPAGSATTFNNMITQEMESGGKGAFLKYGTSLPTMVREGIQAWELGKNSELLAKMLTDPQSVEKLNELAKTKPNSTKARNIVNSVVGGYVGQKPELTPEENK